MHPEKGLPEALQVPAARIREKRDLLHKAAVHRVLNAHRLQSEIRREEEVPGETAAHQEEADHLTERSGIGIPIGIAAHREAAEAVIIRLRKVNRRLSRTGEKKNLLRKAVERRAGEIHRLSKSNRRLLKEQKNKTAKN